MIQLVRPVKPIVLAKNEAKWLASLTSAKTDKARKRAEAKYRNPQIKQTLIVMSADKCSYCESKLLHIDYGDIEHFRPKSQPAFRDLIFEWENLLLSCKICNGKEFKGSQFPDANAGGPPIDPSSENPSQYLSFFFDPISEIASVIAINERGRVTRDLFGLNRPSLRAYRSKYVKKLLVLRKLGVGRQEVQQLLVEASASSAEFAAFARSLTASPQP